MKEKRIYQYQNNGDGKMYIKGTRTCLKCDKELDWNFQLKKWVCSDCGYECEE